MLLHDKVLKHHPFAASLPVKQVPSKIGQKTILVILKVVMYIALKGILSHKSSLVLQKAFSCLLSLLHLSIIGELKSQIGTNGYNFCFRQSSLHPITTYRQVFLNLLKETYIS